MRHALKTLERWTQRRKDIWTSESRGDGVDQEQGKTSEWAKARLNRVTKTRANGRFKTRARGSEGRSSIYPRLALSWEAGARTRELPDHAGDDLVASAVFRGVQAMAVRGKQQRTATLRLPHAARLRHPAHRSDHRSDLGSRPRKGKELLRRRRDLVVRGDDKEP